MASADITVAVERAVHDGIRELVQRVYELHGIEIQRVMVDWRNDSALGATKRSVEAVQVDSRTAGEAWGVQ